MGPQDGYPREPSPESQLASPPVSGDIYKGLPRLQAIHRISRLDSESISALTVLRVLRTWIDHYSTSLYSYRYLYRLQFGKVNFFKWFALRHYGKCLHFISEMRSMRQRYA